MVNLNPKTLVFPTKRRKLDKDIQDEKKSFAFHPP